MANQCAIYRRCSTDEQANSGLGLEAQLAACEAYAKAHSLAVVGVYADEAITGGAGLDERPELLEAVSRLGRGDVLLVAKRDRLGRGDPVLLAMIEAAVNRKGARVVSAAGEGTESDDPASILMRRMVDAFAEYEKRIIGARTKAALAAKIRKGERVGRLRYGYSLEVIGVDATGKEITRLIENQTEQAAIARMVGMRSEGHSLRRIAATLDAEGFPTKDGKPWAAASIKRILERKVHVNGDGGAASERNQAERSICVPHCEGVGVEAADLATVC